MKKSSKYLLLLLSFLTIPLKSEAVVVERGNLVYDLDESAMTASVVSLTEEHSGYTMVLIIPDTLDIGGNKFAVTRIYNDAFANDQRLMKVTIPETVTSIDERAFSGCSVLTNVLIPNSVTTIGENAFYRCSALTDVVIY